MNDLTLWGKLKEGDRAAFEEIYRTHAATLLKYGRKFSRNDQLIEDCVQDLFVELWRNREGLGMTDSIHCYLLVALRRKVIKTLSTTQKRLSEAEPTEVDFDTEITVDQQLIAEELSSERAAQLKEAMEKLSKRQKEVIYLKYITGLDYEDISEVMGLNYQSARNLVSAALRAMKKQILMFIWGFAF